jgi:hypothetical protein
VLPVLRNLLNALSDERRQLFRKRKNQSQQTIPSSIALFWIVFSSYVETCQIRTHICAHFLVVDNVSSPLGVSAHGAGAVSLVVVFAGLLGGQRQAADCAEERGGGLHCGCGVRLLEGVLVFPHDVVVVVGGLTAVAGIIAAFGSVDFNVQGSRESGDDRGTGEREAEAKISPAEREESRLKIVRRHTKPEQLILFSIPQTCHLV